MASPAAWDAENLKANRFSRKTIGEMWQRTTIPISQAGAKDSADAHFYGYGLGWF
jgi:hypothetical protein